LLWSCGVAAECRRFCRAGAAAKGAGVKPSDVKKEIGTQERKHTSLENVQIMLTDCPDF